MLDWIQQTMTTLGYPGVALLMFLENVFPPIPSELIMPLAGFSAANGDLSFVGVFIAGALGSLLGQLPLYYLGRWAHEDRLVRWADRYGKWLTLSGKDIKKADDWFDKHGNKAVFLARLVPGLRSLISIPAGMSEMPLTTFLALFGARQRLVGAVPDSFGRRFGSELSAGRDLSRAGFASCLGWTAGFYGRLGFTAQGAAVG